MTSTNPAVFAIGGVLFVVPFLIANAIVANRIEPYFSLIRPGMHTSSQEYLLLFAVVFLIPVGAFVAARPLLRSGLAGRRPIHLLNALVALVLCVLFGMLLIGAGSDIFRCDVLRIPDCD